MAKKRIGVVVGSLRKGSYNQKVADVLKGMLPADFAVEQLSIGDLALYNQDFDDEGNVPDAWRAFRETVGRMDAFLFVTPEYNRSVPPVLKNALDVASRPYGQNQWGGKPAAVVSVSTGGIGGFGANHHLRQSLTFLDVYAMQQPEAYIGNCAKLFDDAGQVSEGSKGFMQSAMDAFTAWVNRF